VFFSVKQKSYTYDAGYTYVAGQPYQDEIRQLLKKIVQKKFPRTPSKKSLIVLGINSV
jgi:hypothetical protein